MDPVSVAHNGNTYWEDPYDGVTYTWSSDDQSAVALQLRQELQTLQAVLLYMVNESTNMKDVIAGQQGSAALALTSAAATIYCSTLHPSVYTKVTVSSDVLLNSIGSVFTKAASAATGLPIPNFQTIETCGQHHQRCAVWHFDGVHLSAGQTSADISNPNYTLRRRSESSPTTP